MGPTNLRTCSLVVFAAWIVTTPGVGWGQGPDPLISASPVAALPDAPSPSLNDTRAHSSGEATAHTESGTPLSKYHRVVFPNEIPQPLTSADKLKLSVLGRLTVADGASTVFLAGWSHVLNSAPHYGTDSGAFGERLGALALNQTAQSIFSYGIYASMFHDDPRYYVMGPGRKSVGVRALYAASRVFITQKDDGRPAINWPRFAGLASATALTNTYYPTRDRGFAHGAASFGVSLGTSMLNNELHEFIGDGVRLLKHNHAQSSNQLSAGSQ